MPMIANKHTSVQHLESSTSVLQFTFNQTLMCTIKQFLTGYHSLFSATDSSFFESKNF